MTEPVGERHEDRAADPRLQVLFGGHAIADAESRCEDSAVRLEDRDDRDLEQANTDPAGEVSSVPHAPFRGVGPGHRDADDPVRTECFHGQDRGHGGIDSSRQTEDGARETALAGIVGQGQHQGAPQP